MVRLLLASPTTQRSPSSSNGRSDAVVPVSPMDILWIVVEPLVFRILNILLFSFGTFGRYTRRGWYFPDKARTHEELREALVLVPLRDFS